MRAPVALFSILAALVFAGCGSAQVEEAPAAPPAASAKPLPPPQIVASKNLIASTPPASSNENAPTPAASETKVAPAAPAPQAKPAQDTEWKMKNGKLHGPEQAAAKQIGSFTDPKTGHVTVTRCWNYGGFAITESTTKGEVGAGEVIVRRAASPKDKLCASEFSGKSDSLDIIEGYFAGVAGDYVYIEGADVGEGPPQFQIFSLPTGKQVFKSVHHGRKEFVVTQHGRRQSVTYFAPVKVDCELANEGEACWKKVLARTPMAKRPRLPDCEPAYAKAKMAKTESALVTVKAQVHDVGAPKIQYLGVEATCEPAPL